MIKLAVPANRRVADGKGMNGETEYVSESDTYGRRLREIDRCTIIMKFQAYASTGILWYIRLQICTRFLQRLSRVID